MDTFDYVIVGGGSAGCVLANRLSADPGIKVALLEAGGKDSNPWIHVPVGYFKTMYNNSVNWCFKTESDPGLNGRQIDWPRGKVLGGSSSINGLLYVRGQPEDYDRWRQMGNTGWGWDDVLPLFKRTEDFEGGGDEIRGDSGPLKVSIMPMHRQITDAWIHSALSAGYEFNADYNGSQQEGISLFQLTTANGRRCSAAVAYLKPVRNRSNLRIVTNALAKRILIDDGRAVGVAYQARSGNEETISARREVIISCGTIGSPHLLMLSGIGEAKTLHAMGIDVVANLWGVGKNLQDHLQSRLVFKCNIPTMNDEVNNLVKRIGIAIEYVLYRKGPMTMAASLATGFLKTNQHISTPDIQFHIQPFSADNIGKGVHPFSAFTASVCQLRPESRGEIQLKTRNPGDYPAILPNYLATETDRRVMIEGVKIARNIASESPLREKLSGEHQPGNDVVTDDEILEWIRNTSTTIYHPTGTCKMGPGNDAVVDDQLRVKNIGGLRVADCSIMPEIVSGNTNAPAIMIGEKASDLILGSSAV